MSGLGRLGLYIAQEYLNVRNPTSRNEPRERAPFAPSELELVRINLALHPLNEVIKLTSIPHHTLLYSWTVLKKL